MPRLSPLPEFSAYQLSQMDHLVLLSSGESTLAEELKKHFFQMIPEVEIKDTVASKDRFIIDLTLMDSALDSDASQVNFKLLNHAIDFANNDIANGMYVIVGSSDFTSTGSAAYAGYLGLAKTADLEWDKTTVKAIGIENTSSSIEMAAIIFDEVTKGGMDNEVFYDTTNQRFKLEMQELVTENPSVSLQRNDTLIVTGGGRGVTADCIIALAKEVPLNIALFGRTELFEEPETTQTIDEKGLKSQLVKDYQAAGKPIDLKEIAWQANRIISNREILKTINKLKELGATPSYHAVDVTDSKAVKQEVAVLVKQYGSIQGIIHGAGVLADKLIKDKTEEQFLRVFNTKVKGFENIIEATADQSLTHICCFTSVAGRFGNTGQSDYSMANEVLNKMCIAEQAQRGSSCNVTALNWGAWEGGMVTDEIKAHFEAMGVVVIPRKNGADVFVDALQRTGSTEVAIGDGLHNWMNQLTKQNMFACWVHESTFPILHHHVISDTVVFPMASIIGQAEKIGTYYFNDSDITVKNLSVKNGLKLNRFYDQGEWIVFKTQENTGQLLMEVIDTDSSMPNYTLEITNESYQPLHLPDIHFSGGPYPKKSMVDHPGYFHGEPLQVLAGVIGISSEGSDYEVEAIDNKNYRIKLMDGAFQTACVHAGYARSDGSYAIPMGCESFHWFSVPKLDQKLLFKLRIVDHNDIEFLSNIQLVDADTNEAIFEVLNATIITYQPELAQ